jgi:hypothetical protein
LLQHIESLGSFWLGVRRIDWRTAEEGWEPEDEQERKSLGLRTFRRSSKYPVEPQPVIQGMLAEIVQSHERLAHLTIPMAFYREGNNAFLGHQYVNAFYNFYFLLEDLYAEGKVSNKEVSKRFKNSPQLRQAVEEALQHLAEPANARHLRRIQEHLSHDNLSLSVDGVLDLIVKMRGDLHHFSQRSTRPKGHPLNQHKFESPAYLLLSICLMLIPTLMSPDDGPS